MLRIPFYGPKNTLCLLNKRKMKNILRNFSSVTRGKYATLNDSHVSQFEKMLGSNGVLKDNIEAYNTDWLNTHKGKSQVVLRPSSVQEVSAVLRYCNSENLAVCPQGGNTGLVTGSIPIFDEIILSTCRLNKIIDIDEMSGCITCEAGVVLETAQDALSDKGLITPYDLGSKGTCQIGGNLSTCAGGLRLLRYNSLLANTLGLQVVLANGEILDCLSGLRKDNTGYHLRQIFIGAEGTLGLITAAVIHCPVKPSAINLAFLGVDSYEDVMSIISLARNKLSEIVSALEFMDWESFNVSSTNLKQKHPLDTKHRFYVMVETHGSNQDHDRQKMDDFIEVAMDKGFVKNGTVADQPSTIRALWKVRESIAEGLSKDAIFLTYDITLPRQSLYKLITSIRQKYQHVKDCSISGSGHLGDGNIHVNVRCNESNKDEFKDLERYIYEWTREKKGSLSSEHGIGFRKASYLGYAKSQTAIDVMKSIKTNLDPKHILNPYKVLPNN